MTIAEKKSPDQIASDARESDQLKARLLELTSRVPQSVNAGSYQDAVTWKAAAVKGRKLAESRSPKLAELRQISQTLESYR